MQLDTKKSESSGSKKKSSDNGDDSKVIIIAWILLGLGTGLCVIAAVICLVIRFNHDNSMGVLDKNVGAVFPLSNEIDDNIYINNRNFNFSLDILHRGAPTLNSTKQGCSEVSCRIDCSDNENIYEDIVHTMNDSYCEVFTSLLVRNQNQISLEDKWISNTQSKVLKIVLNNNKFKAINSGAFCTPMFSKVFHMSWINLQLEELSNGALLGLYALRILELEFELPSIRMSFLQPVQVTLLHLRINCGITIMSHLNIFDNIYLENLMYLDLSSNRINGPIGKHMFSATPNITYLYLKYCHITAIEDNAFEDLANKLILVDLKHNLLTHINADVFRVIGPRVLFDLEPNNWHCDCRLGSLIQFYNENKKHFISVPYCRLPFRLYGINFDHLNALELGCDELSTDWPSNASASIERGEEISGNDDDWDKDKISTESPFGTILQFKCSPPIAYDNTSKQDVTVNSGKFVFEPPTYDLNLHLFENRSVRACIGDYSELDPFNIIWFSDDYDMNSADMFHNCMQYEHPFLIIEPLKPNHTYTFCMIPIDHLVISPLLCQPLHVPLPRNTNDSEIWISEDEKQFTIGMLCLIFFISTVFGAIFAYLGIKSFPNLLEGSKNVLVIKESEKQCCVSTISESDYIKAPIDKPQRNSLKVANRSYSKTSTTTSGTELPSLTSLRSSSTCFEESFSHTDIQSIDYEMPIKYNNYISRNSNLSNYAEKPQFPPPLPKRNSNISLGLDQKPTTF